MCCASLIILAALDLGALFSDKANWNAKSEFFAVDHKNDGFEFASGDRSVVNCLKHDTCTYRGLKVWETKVYFDKQSAEESIVRVEMSLYNRGDAGTERMTLDELKAEIAQIAGYFEPNAKKPQVTKTTLRNSSMQYRRRFEKSDPAGELVWGLTAPDDNNHRGVDYLRLTLTAGAQKGTKKTAASTGKAKAKVKDNVAKSPNGDVYIDNVPMVDQGQKGYCSAAAAERVLRYYGNAIDEHEIAQLAGTTAQGGTSTDAMRETVRVVGEKNGLGFQNIVSLSAGVGDLEDEIARYNKAAKIEKKPSLSLDTFTHGHMIHVSEMRAAMDGKVIYRMRQKDARLKKFSAGIRQQVNAGIPVFWGVTLGIFPERGVNPQSTGGHMRLIIGYNDKKKEILYTDTWGEGHELKRMPEDWAFAITHDAFFLKPR